MPRNCGCDNKCSCVIKEGSGASVTGVGTASNPYVIATDGGGGGGGFDPGDLKWSARNTPPAGWLVADGAAVSRATFEDLFDAIGTLYGDGDGSTTFNLPDFTGRFVLGADGAHSQGSTGGAEEHTLTTGQMPAHQHTMTPGGAHSHEARRSGSDGGTASVYRTGASAGSVVSGALVTTGGAHTHDMSGAGGGQPFSKMPPYATALPLIKT